MAGKEESRIFVGGLSFHTDERKLKEAFRRFGKVVNAQFGEATLAGRLVELDRTGIVFVVKGSALRRTIVGVLCAAGTRCTLRSKLRVEIALQRGLADAVHYS